MIDFLDRWHHEMIAADTYPKLAAVALFLIGLAMIEWGERKAER